MPRPSVRVDHLALPAFDAAATHDFYTRVMGFPLSEAFCGDDWGGRPWLMMIFDVGDGRKLALCTLRGLKRPRADAMPADLRHFAFAARSQQDLQAWRRRLRAADIAFHEEDHGAQRSLYFTDPNGTMLEVTAPASESAMPANPRAVDVVRRWIGQS